MKFWRLMGNRTGASMRLDGASYESFVLRDRQRSHASNILLAYSDCCGRAKGRARLPASSRALNVSVVSVVSNTGTLRTLHNPARPQCFSLSVVSVISNKGTSVFLIVRCVRCGTQDPS